MKWSPLGFLPAGSAFASLAQVGVGDSRKLGLSEIIRRTNLPRAFAAGALLLKAKNPFAVRRGYLPNFELGYGVAL